MGTTCRVCGTTVEAGDHGQVVTHWFDGGWCKGGSKRPRGGGAASSATAVETTPAGTVLALSVLVVLLAVIGFVGVKFVGLFTGDDDSVGGGGGRSDRCAELDAFYADNPYDSNSVIENDYVINGCAR